MYEINDGWMIFDDGFDEPLSKVVFPSGIQKVRFGWYFNQDISNALPNSITHLSFEYWGEFNQDVSQLPNSLTHLRFGFYFNQDIHNLPNSLTHLTFGDYFNKDVSNATTLPNSLTHLRFGIRFNQNVNNLPNSLTHLTFSYYSNFNQEIHNLPNSLTHLIFGWNFNQNVSQLPKSITYLKFSMSGNSKFNHNLNPYLYHLTSFDIKNSHKHKRLMLERCQINQHNISIREDKLIDLLLKN